MNRRLVRLFRVAAAVVASSTLIGDPSSAQEATALVGVQGTAAASGLHVTYDPQGLLPISSPVNISAPDVLSTISSGPTTFARASIADPGDLLANPDAALALLSSDYKPGTLPPYPFRISATSGLGAPEADSTPAPGLSARVKATAEGSSATASGPQVAAPGVVTLGAITTSASTATDGNTATLKARTTVAGFDVLGLITIGSVVTDVTATADANGTKVSGGTKIVDARLLGMPITIDSTGVHADAANGSGSLLETLLGSGAQGVVDALETAGIKLTVASPVTYETTDSGKLTAAGLRLDLELSQQTIPVLGQLLDSLPPIDVPGVEDLLQVARARHLVSVQVAQANVDLTARPARPARPAGEVELPSVDLPTFVDGGSLVGAMPDLPAVIPSVDVPAEPTRNEPKSTTLATGLGAVALLALLAQPFAGVRLARFADALLLPGGAGSCAREDR